MHLQTARETLEQIEDIKRRLRDVEDGVFGDEYPYPFVIPSIQSDLDRLRDWTRRIVAAREQEALEGKP